MSEIEVVKVERLIKASKIIDTADKYIGYLEKKDGTEKYLSDRRNYFTQNAGFGKYTLFGKWYGEVKVDGNPNQWSGFFISYIFYKATGSLCKAKELLAGDIFSSCWEGVKQFRNKNQWYKSNPKVGDIIFFTDGTTPYHAGIVYYVNDEKVYTMEGNTSGKEGVIENGGSVTKKSYLITNKKILGYGRPNYRANKNTVKIYYTVKANDTLEQVANRYASTISDIARRNELKNIEVLCIGDKLFIDEYRTHKVSKGETLLSISDKYLGTFTRYEEIFALNDLKSSELTLGQKLMLPN